MGVEKKPKKAPGKMGAPVTMPGVWGMLAKAMGGVAPLCFRVGVPIRTMRAWAKNERPLHDALVASKIADLCDSHGVAPMLFEDDQGAVVGCSPLDGWVTFPKGWETRTRYPGPVGLKWMTACPAAHRHARDCGWPY